jgi:hypothetical protein
MPTLSVNAILVEKESFWFLRRNYEPKMRLNNETGNSLHQG